MHEYWKTCVLNCFFLSSVVVTISHPNDPSVHLALGKELVIFLMKLFIERLSCDLKAVGPALHLLSKPVHDKSRRIKRSAREIKRESKFVSPVSWRWTLIRQSCGTVHIFKPFVERGDKEAHSVVPSSQGKGLRSVLERRLTAHLMWCTSKRIIKWLSGGVTLRCLS